MSTETENNAMIASKMNPMRDITKVHEAIEEKYRNINPLEVVADPNTMALLRFNGYYALDIVGAPGAFFAVDANMHIKDGIPQPIYDISLVISLDGTTSERVQFTGSDGTFENNVLTFSTPGNLNGRTTVNLTFTPTNSGDGTTAQCKGTIGIPKHLPVAVTGTSYNNPISSEMFVGKYHVEILGILPEDCQVLEIQKNYSILYDFGVLHGDLVAVQTYTYNLNMYYFSIPKQPNSSSANDSSDSKSSKLIMGTSPSGGLVCNNMLIDGPKVTTRMIQTIEICENISTTKPVNTNSSVLAQFAGYYPISNVAPGAFVAIEGNYTVQTSGGNQAYTVTIGVSLDGMSTKVYTFDTSMSFTNNVLTIPSATDDAPNILSLTFDRTYGALGNFGSLVSITGTVEQYTASGYTAFNPVPLSSFGGAHMTSIINSEVLIVNSDTAITFNGHAVSEFLYVPIMYILAFTDPASQNQVLLSFGTDGCAGNTCIITESTTPNPLISVVYAIPSMANA